MFYAFVSFQLVISNIDESLLKTRLIGSSEVVQSIVIPALSVDSQSTTFKLESVVARLVKVEVPDSVVSSSGARTFLVVVVVVTVVLSVVSSDVLGVVVVVVLIVVLIVDDSVVGLIVVVVVLKDVVEVVSIVEPN